jgi:hypothetical protein
VTSTFEHHSEILYSIKGREILEIFNPLKPKLVQIIFKDSVRTSKRTQQFTITRISFLTLFKEIIAVYIEAHARPINTERIITDW